MYDKQQDCYLIEQVMVVVVVVVVVYLYLYLARKEENDLIK
jgi:protein-S-isoprenylcysteine O-methyltransferase Ste14